MFEKNKSLEFVVIVITYEYLFIWSIFFIRYLFLFLYSLIAYQITKIKNFFLNFVSFFPLIFCFLPFIISKDKKTIINIMRFQLNYIVNPIAFLVCIYFLIQFIYNYKKIENVIIKTIIKIFFIFSSTFLILVIMDFYHLYPLKLNFIFFPKNWITLSSLFIWNLLSILLFVLYYKNCSRLRKIKLIDFKNISLDFNESLKKYEKSNLDKEKALSLLEKISYIMEKEKIYLDPNLSLMDLSEITGESKNNISEVLNVYKGQSFYKFINYYRVEEVKKAFLNPDNTNKNILEIAFDCGFNSKNAFYSAFKLFVGINPLDYRKNHLKRK